MSNDKKQGGCGTAVITIFIVFMLLGLMGSCSDSESSYERDFNSGYDKWTSGEFDSMTDSEKRAVEDFIEWSNEN